MLSFTSEKVIFQYVSPGNELDLFVDYFFYLNISNVDVKQQYIFPSVSPKLLCHLIPAPEVKGRKETLPPLSRSYFFGPNDKAHQVKYKNIRVLGCKFHPWGLYPLVKKALHLTSIRNRRLDTKLILDDKESSRLNKITDFNDFIHLLSSLLRNYYDSFLYDKNINLLRQVCLQSEMCYGKADADLQHRGIGKRQFQRVFKQYTGVTFSRYIKIKRLQRLLKYKIAHPGEKLTGLVYDFGYFDQSHFNRDFKSVVGTVPSLFFKDDFISTSHHFFMMDV